MLSFGLSTCGECGHSCEHFVKKLSVWKGVWRCEWTWHRDPAPWPTARRASASPACSPARFFSCSACSSASSSLLDVRCCSSISRSCSRWLSWCDEHRVALNACCKTKRTLLQKIFCCFSTIIYTEYHAVMPFF